MKINIDLRYTYNIGGISNYIRNIASVLSIQGTHEYCGSTFWYHGRSRGQYDWFKGKINQSLLPDRLVCNLNCILPISYEIATTNFSDINLCLTYRLPRLRFQKPVISTIHDIILLKTKTESKKVISEHENILRHTINTSKHILTVSEATKNDLIEYFGINHDAISIVHNGIDFEELTEPVSEEIKERIRGKYKLPEHFILNFGAYRTHKNIERLLKSYALLPCNLRKDYKLVLTRTNDILNKMISDLKIEKDTIITGFVDEVDKKAFYQMADVVYYASLYEGFGVPVIESQACGTPVLTSNTSSLPEAAGGAALLVDPYSVDEIRDGLLTLIQDTSLRNSLINNGLENAKQYSWERSAKEVEDVLNTLSL